MKKGATTTSWSTAWGSLSNSPGTSWNLKPRDPARFRASRRIRNSEVTP